MGRVFKPQRKLSNGRTWTSKRWYVEYRDAAGKQHRKPASDSKRESLGLLKELEGQARRQSLGIDPTRSPKDVVSLEDLIEEYLEDAETRLRPRTYETYRDVLLEVLLGVNRNGKRRHSPLELEELTLAWASSFQRQELRRSSPRTVNKKLRVVSQLLNWSVKRSYLSSSPLMHLQMLPQPPQTEPRALTRAEVDRLLRASPKEARDVWVFFLETGMRKGEVAALRWEDIQLEGGRITISARTSKNHRRRIIPMSERVSSILHQRQDSKGEDPQSLVFPSILGRSRFYDGALDAFRACCKKASISGVNLHSLRRTFTVRMLEAGVSPAVVQRLLGHSTARLTLEVYATVSDDDLLAAVPGLP
ncbi:tyrosine-type recombinase/integrase [Planctomycetota bacterium]|nr:tyrosine-type recombinase/integrase [Planctomycetota bacterium]